MYFYEELSQVSHLSYRSQAVLSVFRFNFINRRFIISSPRTSTSVALVWIVFLKTLEYMAFPCEPFEDETVKVYVCFIRYDVAG
jgi:hypothetical protein